MSSRALSPSVRKKCGQLAKLVVQMLCDTTPGPGPQPSEVSTEVGGVAACLEANAVRASAWRPCNIAVHCWCAVTCPLLTQSPLASTIGTAPPGLLRWCMTASCSFGEAFKQSIHMLHEAGGF